MLAHYQRIEASRADLPFASSGGLQTLTADFSGGPLGGTTAFQRYTGEARSFVTVGQFGGGVALFVEHFVGRLRARPPGTARPTLRDLPCCATSPGVSP